MASTASRTTCIDTSSLIHAWVRAYPLEIFPKLWKHFDTMIASRLMIAPVDVFNELKRVDDDLYGWAQERRDMFIELDLECQECLADIMATHSSLVNVQARKSTADPAVIAVAMAKNARVLTQEQSGGQSFVKIPDVCKAKTVVCMNLLDFMRAEGLRFK